MQLRLVARRTGSPSITLRELGRRAQHHGHVEAERAARSPARAASRASPSPAGAAEDDVAALDVGDDVLEPELLERRHELLHRQLARAADVDAAEQRDVDGQSGAGAGVLRLPSPARSQPALPLGSPRDQNQAATTAHVPAISSRSVALTRLRRQAQRRSRCRSRGRRTRSRPPRAATARARAAARARSDASGPCSEPRRREAEGDAEPADDRVERVVVRRAERRSVNTAAG